MDTSSHTHKFLRLGLTTILTFSTAAATFSTAMGSWIAVRSHLQVQFNQQQSARLKRAQASYQQNDYEICIAEAQNVSPMVQIFSDAQALLQVCQTLQAQQLLNQAKGLAAEGRFAAAIARLDQMPPSLLTAEARQLLRVWSERILAIAQEQYWQPTDQMSAAIKIANAIPANSPVYEAAQAWIQQSQLEWQTNQQYLQAAWMALEQGDLAIARSTAQHISSHPFWQVPMQSVMAAIAAEETEQYYQHILKTAKWYLEQGEPENAIHVVSELPNHHPWGERKQKIIQKARAKLRQIRVCQILSLGLLSCR
jgi:hypothetical protein